MAPAIGKKASRFAKQMKKVQSVLGDHQDAVIAYGPVDLPQQHGDVLAAQGPVPRQACW
jgi:CHAD domain-containing protein